MNDKIAYQIIGFWTVVSLLLLGVILLLLSNNNIDTCSVKLLTGIACESCGMTRDFIGFVKLDFSNPINPKSGLVFTFIVFQIFWRIFLYLLSGKKISKNFITIDVTLTCIASILVGIYISL